MPDTLDGLFISELLADNAGGTAIDHDGDGNTNKADEYIEIQNNSGSTISLDGYELWSQANGELYEFSAGDTIDPGDVAVVMGNYTGTPPSGSYDAGIAENADFIPDGQGNKFDTIYLVNRDTGDYVIPSYGNPPRPPTPPAGFPGTNLIGSGESIDSGAPNGVAFARDANGILIETTPSPGTPNIPYFLEGTYIETSNGALPIQDLRPNDMVLTMDNGLQPLRGLRRSRVNALTLLREPRARPIVFPALPGFDPLLLSPSHRILVHAAAADLLFDAAEVLVSAQNTLSAQGVSQKERLAQVVYYHLLFDCHELICANGYWCESLYSGTVTQATFADEIGWRADPDVVLSDISHSSVVRRVLTGYETSVLLRQIDPADMFVTKETVSA